MLAALRKYNIALSAGTAGSDLVRLSIRKSGSDTFATGSDWSPVAGDVKVSKDGGVQANITTLPSYSNGSWEFTLSAAELSAKTVRVIVSNASIINDDFTVETFGNASAMYSNNDYTDGVRMGMTALWNAIPGAVGGAPLSVDASGRVDVLKINGTSQTARDLGASVLLSNGTGAGQISLSSGTVTVGTNNDKSGYSLTQTFPTNFSSFSISAGGAVTVGTNNDKTGYSLATAPPTAAAIATQIWQDLLSGADFGTAGSIGALLKADIDAAISSRSTYAGGDTSGTTTLLSRITGSLAPTTGDAYARLGAPAGASVSADLAAVKTDTGNLISRLGAWTGTGINTVLGAFRAMANKLTGLTPADLTSGGGTFDNTTDSNEAIADGSGGGGGQVTGYAAGQDPATLVLDALASAHNNANSIGAKINSAGASGDPLANPVPGSYAAGTAGHILGQFSFDASDNVYANARAGVPILAGNVPSSTSPALSGSKMTAATNYPFSQIISVSNLDASSWTKLEFVVKANPSDPDSAAKLTIQLSNPGSGSDGLTLLNGAAPVAPVIAADGSITVGTADTTGLSITVATTARGMGVVPGSYFWELAVFIGGAKAAWLGSGTFSVVPTVYAAAV